MVTFG